MKYASIGTSTSGPEVTDVSSFGLWMIYQGREYFLDYDVFPWFLNAPIKKIFNVLEEGINHLRWPDLDVDLSLESIEQPANFPMVYAPSGSYGSTVIE